MSILQANSSLHEQKPSCLLHGCRSRAIFFAASVIVVLSAATTTHACGKARAFQRQQNIFITSNANAAYAGRLSFSLLRMITQAPCNQSFDWPTPQNPVPPSFAPPGAQRIVIDRRCGNLRRLHSICGQPCWREESQTLLWIIFDDGCEYLYDYQSSMTVCADGSKQRIIRVADWAGGPNTDVDYVRSLLFDSSGSALRRAGARLSGSSGPGTAIAAGVFQLTDLDGFDGADEIEIRVPPGGTLDLTSHTNGQTIATANQSVQIFADTVLLPPDFTLTDLFSPDPIVSPGAFSFETFISLYAQPCDVALPTGVLVEVRNLANTTDTLTILWEDSMGWAVGGPFVLQSVAPWEARTVEIPLSIPPDTADVCDVDTLTIVAQPSVGTGVSDVVSLDIMLNGDVDLDGVRDLCDNCPGATNPEQADSDMDADGLQMPDAVGDVCDNCPVVYNPTQADNDGNGIGDLCQIESIPTVSEWGMLTLSLLILTAGIIVYRYRAHIVT